MDLYGRRLPFSRTGQSTGHASRSLLRSCYGYVSLARSVRVRLRCLRTVSRCNPLLIQPIQTNGWCRTSATSFLVSSLRTVTPSTGVKTRRSTLIPAQIRGTPVVWGFPKVPSLIPLPSPFGPGIGPTYSEMTSWCRLSGLSRLGGGVNARRSALVTPASSSGREVRPSCHRSPHQGRSPWSSR